jgi:hypothetical protein
MNLVLSKCHRINSKVRSNVNCSGKEVGSSLVLLRSGMENGLTLVPIIPNSPYPCGVILVTTRSQMELTLGTLLFQDAWSPHCLGCHGW